jgi:hypothetical protein
MSAHPLDRKKCGCHKDCECKCHEKDQQVQDCCAELIECLKGPKEYCCGDPIPPNRPKYPEPPKTNTTDPYVPPAQPGRSTGDTKTAFLDAVFGIVKDSGRPKGVKMPPRKDSYLPFLVIRAVPGDHGNRPFSGVFWESPDIFVAPNMEASTAPAKPPTLGGMAVAGKPNTLWARVWNLGLAPGVNVRVEFYWCNPSLGINSVNAKLIGAAYVDLGNRFSTTACQIVKCPQTWVPTFENDGHECLVVRVFEPLLDPVSNSVWEVAKDRHTGQRNIAVVQAQSPAHLELKIKTGCTAPQGNAQISVERVPVTDVYWLAILKGKKEHGYKPAANQKTVLGIMTPGSISKQNISFQGVSPEAVQRLVHQSLDYERTCDEKETFLYMHLDDLKPGECDVFRVIHRVNGKISGGYTVIAKKD